MSPCFARYVRDSVAHTAGIGLVYYYYVINIVLYVDDGPIVLLAPSWWGLQQLLDLVVQQSVRSY